MPVRVYETSDGETIYETVYMENPIIKTRYVTRNVTSYVDAERVRIVPVTTAYVTVIETPTRYVTVEIKKPVYKTRIVTTYISKVSKPPKSGNKYVSTPAERHGGRYTTPGVPRERKERTVSV